MRNFTQGTRWLLLALSGLALHLSEAISPGLQAQSCYKVGATAVSSRGSVVKPAYREYDPSSPPKYYKAEEYFLSTDIYWASPPYPLTAYRNIYWYATYRHVVGTGGFWELIEQYGETTSGGFHVGSSLSGPNNGWAAEYESEDWWAAEEAYYVGWTGQGIVSTGSDITDTSYTIYHHYTTDNDVIETWSLSVPYPWSEVISEAHAAVAPHGQEFMAYTHLTEGPGSMEAAVQKTVITAKIPKLPEGEKFLLKYDITSSLNGTKIGSVNVTGSNEEQTIVLQFGPPDIKPPTYKEEITYGNFRLETAEDEGGGGGCNTCTKTMASAPGSGDPNLKSVDLRLSLGGGNGHAFAGYLEVSGNTPSSLLRSPSNLVFRGFSDLAQVFTNASGVITNVIAPLAYVDVVEVNTNKYEVKYYGFDGTNYLTNGSPFVTWRIEDPDGGTNSFKKLQVTEIRGAQSITNLYEWSDLYAGWSLNRAGLSKELKFTVVDSASQWTVHHWHLNPATDGIIAKNSQTYQTNSWGISLVKEVRGETNGLQVATHTYDGAGNRTGTDYSSGGWERMQYNSSNWVTKVFRPFQGSAATTTESACRVTEYSYTPATGSDDDGTVSHWVPRLTVEKVLGTEVSRTYTIITTNETRTIVCTVPGADWDDASNLVSVTRTYADGDFGGWTESELRPDGTLTFYEYERDMVNNLTTTTYSGAPGVGGTNIVDGVKTVTLVGAARELISRTQWDIASNIMIAQEVHSQFDNLRRPGKITYLNGSTRLLQYACCGVEVETDENGIETAYTYDALKRRTSVTRAGVSTINILDAASRTVTVWRQGTNSTMMLMSSNVYNTASELVTSYDALENETGYSRSVDGNGVRTETVTHPDQTTSVTTYFRDGSQKSLGGTAQHGVRWEYGVETEGGVARTYAKQIRLHTNGVDSDEWVKTYTDAVGNSYKTVYPDEAAETTYFNDKGQAWKSVDADGVVRLSQYNTMGHREYTVLDVDRDDVIDFSGDDRITRSLSYATNAHGVDVVRSETWQWQTLGANTPVLLSTSDRSVETKESWQFAFGLTNYSIHVCVTNLVVCYSTNVAPDGSYTVSVAQYGLPLSSTRYASNGVQLAQQSMGYDEFNRTITITDARTGTITNTLDALGRTLTRTTPAPAPGQNPQTTQMDYDNRGRVWRVIEPDGGVVVTTYHPTGELKRKVGNRTYPVDYTYDYAGRMKTLKTWQDFDNDSGAAITTWNYDSQRGFMTSKRYADNKGPDYEYTLTGKLAKRTWARGIETDYTYNDAGDLETVDYSDSTPDVTYTYDRVGRRATVAQGSQDAVTLHYTAAGQLAAEQHTSGLLSGITVTNAYDGLLRRTGLTVLTNGGSVYQALYGYDAASRMLTVSDGTNNVTYGYVTNSSLVAEIAFKQNSTLRMTTTKQYDLLNRLTNISSTTTSFTNSFAYLYNDANQRTKVTREDGSYWNYGYDDLGQVTSGKRYWADNSPVAGQQYDYDFDDIGNRKSTTSNSKPETRNSLYTANLLNQYTSRTVPGYADVLGTAHSNATVTVNYERAARKGEYWHKELGLNNQGQAVYAGVTNIAVLNDGANPDIVTTNTGKLFLPQTPEQFTYDDDGNLTGDGRWTYTWDGENRLIQMETKTGAISAGTPKQKLEFAYDDRWRRIQKKVSDWNGSSYTATYTNKFAYDGWNLTATLNPTSIQQSFLWGSDISGSGRDAGGAGALLAMNDRFGSANFVAYDGNGNVIALADVATGVQGAVYGYGPFGETVHFSGDTAEGNPFRFSTKYTDDETKVLYYGYRYYCASKARWMSRDPICEKGAIVDNPNHFKSGGRVDFLAFERGVQEVLVGVDFLNTYHFTLNDSVNNIDRLGLLTLQFIIDRVKQRNQQNANAFCCADCTGLQPFFTILGTVTAPETVIGYVPLSMSLGRPPCVRDIEIYWWDCYSASQEAGMLSNWADYGWWLGGLSYSKQASPDFTSLRDPYHLAMNAVMIYDTCENQRVRTKLLRSSRQLQWNWDKKLKAWTGPDVFNWANP